MPVEAPKFTIEMPQLQTNRLLQRQKLIAGVGLSLAGFLMVGLSLALIVPRALDAQAKLKSQKQTVEQSTERAQLVSTLSEEDRANFVRASQVLPASKEPLIILQALSDIADEAQVNLGKYDTNPGIISTGSALANRSTTRLPYQTMQVQVEIEGSFQQINRALELMESTAPMMEVTELSLTPTRRLEESGPASFYTATLQVTSYTLPPQVTTGEQKAKSLTPRQQETLAEILNWRNRLPPNATTPAVFSRTNLFIIEAPNQPAVQQSEISPEFVPPTSETETETEQPSAVEPEVPVTTEPSTEGLQVAPQPPETDE